MQASLVSALGRSSRFLQRMLQRELEPLGLGLAEFRVVGLLVNEPQGLIQTELCERLGVTAPSLSVAVRKLERAGVVERRTHANDARTRRVVLKSRASTVRVERMLDRLDARLTDSLSDREVKVALRVLRHVADTLERELEEA
jgi:DNA-binding MarR family transcriptional regulator